MTAKLNSLAKSRGQSVTENKPEAARERAVSSLPVVSATQPVHSEQPRRRRRIGSRSRSRSHSDDGGSPPAREASTDEDGALAAEVGQLSLNEESELRFHGKASGLHLLGVKDRSDGRNEGGIWRFPKSGVWPPLPKGHAHAEPDEMIPISLPDAQSQEGLLELYFTYVHPSLPVLHKQAFLDDFRLGQAPVVTSVGLQANYLLDKLARHPPCLPALLLPPAPHLAVQGMSASGVLSSRVCYSSSFSQ